MPLTSKGEEIKQNMTKEYGSKKGEQVFYASKNAGKIKGVDEAQPGMVTAPNVGGVVAGRRPGRASDASGGTPPAGNKPTMPTWPGRVV